MKFLFGINWERTSVHKFLGEDFIFVFVVNIDLAHKFSYLFALFEFAAVCPSYSDVAGRKGKRPRAR